MMSQCTQCLGFRSRESTGNGSQQVPSTSPARPGRDLDSIFVSVNSNILSLFVSSCAYSLSGVVTGFDCRKQARWKELCHYNIKILCTLFILDDEFNSPRMSALRPLLTLYGINKDLLPEQRISDPRCLILDHALNVTLRLLLTSQEHPSPNSTTLSGTHEYSECILTDVPAYLMHP